MKGLCQYCVAVALGGAIAMTGCKRESPAPSRRAETTPVTVATVTNSARDKTVAIIGTLYPKDEATIAAQVDGMVERTLVDFGDRVATNQDLAFIDTATYEAQLEQALGNVAKAEAKFANTRQIYDRMQQLQKSGVASASDFDQAKAELDQSEAEARAARGAAQVARINVEHSRVKAPFAGAIAQRFVGRGDFVKAGSPLFNVVNDSVLKFIFQVPERYGSLVQKRLPVQFSVDNYPGEIFTGSVYLISPSVTMSSRAFGVGALVTNTSFRLKANTFARGTLVLERGVLTPVVPVDSVVSFAGVTKVFVVEGNAARSQPVTVGRIEGGAQEIIAGLKAGEIVVVTGQSRLSDGASVMIQAAGPMDSGTNRALTKANLSGPGRHE